MRKKLGKIKVKKGGRQEDKRKYIREKKAQREKEDKDTKFR